MSPASSVVLDSSVRHDKQQKIAKILLNKKRKTLDNFCVTFVVSVQLLHILK